MPIKSALSAPRAPVSARRASWVRWARRTALLLAVFLVAVGAVLARLGFTPTEAWRATRDSEPIEVLRYAELRLIGHSALEGLLLPGLHALRQWFEREPNGEALDLGKGQRPGGLMAQRYDAAGVPIAALPHEGTTADTGAIASRVINSVEGLRDALTSAEAGDVLELAPGNYPIDSTLVTGHAGSPSQPITLRARVAGTATLLSSAEQGLVVNQPYWVFENLVWRGTCTDDSDCEHAYHVVGAARGTVIRNNRLENFNAHVKINGEQDQWPDDGLLQFNTIINTAARQTGRPVSPLDLVGANGWQMLDNRVEHFVKAGGNGVSFGMFMKGGGAGGRIERNIVICAPHGVSQPGLRVGISLGGGGTGPKFCRDGRCAAEYTDGVVANNIVAHCNDVGIDIYHSRHALVAHNTLINTLGIMVRDAPADAEVAANLLEGAVRARRGAVLREYDNRVEHRLDALLSDPDTLDLHWRELPGTLPRQPGVIRDFCAQPRPMANPPGATLAASCLAQAVAHKP